MSTIKQYCRYCVHLCTGNGIWCGSKEKIMRESTAKSVNHCSSFEFCEIDAFGETSGYKPRSEYKPRKCAVDEISDNQISMEGV